MKRLLLFLVCIMSFSLSNAQFRSERFYSYGVDFSYVKVFGAKESQWQLTKAFEDINHLMINENEKYDFGRMVNSRAYVNIDPILEKHSDWDYNDIKLYRSEVNDLDCEEIVKEYDLPEETGIGLVLIAKLLNKDKAIGTYYVVMFDITSRNIIYCKEVSGEAGGFGVRNFWASSVYEVIKRTRIRVNKH